MANSRRRGRRAGGQTARRIVNTVAGNEDDSSRLEPSLQAFGDISLRIFDDPLPRLIGCKAEIQPELLCFTSPKIFKELRWHGASPCYTRTWSRLACALRASASGCWAR